MSTLSRFIRGRMHVRAVVAALAAAEIVVATAGVAWAAAVTRQAAYTGAATYKLTVTNEETATVEVLKIGHVRIIAGCSAGEDPGNPGHLGTGFGFGIQNDGNHAIFVAVSGAREDPTDLQYMVIPAHGGDPIFGIGQGASIDNNYDVGSVTPFTILDSQKGPSVTGLASVWAHGGGTLTQTGTCVFSAQARG